MEKHQNIKKYYEKTELLPPPLNMFGHRYASITLHIHHITRFRTMIRVIKQYLRNKNSVKILDLGCGFGSDVLMLKQMFGNKISKIKGIDLAKNIIKDLRKKHAGKNVEFIYGDAENVDLKEEFDIIISSEVYEHLQDEHKHLEIIKKHLKSNGIAILSTPNRNYFLKDLYSFLRKGKNSEEFDPHINLINYPKMKRLLKEVGLRVVKKERTFVVPGADYMDRYYILLSFINALIPKERLYFGSGMVLVIKKK